MRCGPASGARATRLRQCAPQGTPPTKKAMRGRRCASPSFGCGPSGGGKSPHLVPGPQGGGCGGGRIRVGRGRRCSARIRSVGGGREEVATTDLCWTVPQGGGCGPSGSSVQRRPGRRWASVGLSGLPREEVRRPYQVSRWWPGGGGHHRSVLDCAAGRRLRAVRVEGPTVGPGGGGRLSNLSEPAREEVRGSDLKLLSVVAGRRWPPPIEGGRIRREEVAGRPVCDPQANQGGGWRPVDRMGNCGRRCRFPYFLILFKTVTRGGGRVTVLSFAPTAGRRLRRRGSGSDQGGGWPIPN